MKRVLQLLLSAVIIICFDRSYATDAISELRRLYGKEIKEHGRLMHTLEVTEGELVLAHEVFQNEQCDSSYFVEMPECKRARENVRRLSQQIRRFRDRLSALKLKLKDYLDFSHGVIEDAKAQLDGAGNSITQTSGALSCLETLGALTWGPEINALYTQGMKTLRRLNRQEYFKHLRSLPGFSSDECERNDQVECWRQDSGVYYYVARGHIQISEGCLTQQPGGSGVDWSTFPSNPRDYLDAAVSAAQTVNPRTGCYTSLNHDKAEGLALYFETKRPRIQCQPETNTKESAGRGERCAYSYSGSYDLFLTAPNLCGGMARTLFHEAMHAEGTIDNLHVTHHNNGSCRSYDAIYHCSNFCFPQKPAPSFLHQKGCEKCVSEDRAETMCAKLPADLGPSLQSCGWGGL